VVGRFRGRDQDRDGDSETHRMSGSGLCFSIFSFIACTRKTGAYNMVHALKKKVNTGSDSREKGANL
jgi:hypothetical protein